ncbi:hypothetical protein E2C01_052820 [Portunus trituberculatus]|uniref:Uncharacterized protein n=1 Tax=Portunus trituberculatus TaxID=210409 RepID=A0A5B7GFL1_PORTR|nr:hypothetical protein [Portunus trituberculatus]
MHTGDDGGGQSCSLTPTLVHIPASVLHHPDNAQECYSDIRGSTTGRGGGRDQGAFVYNHAICGDRMACRGVATEPGAEVGDKDRESGGESAMPHHTAPSGPCDVANEEKALGRYSKPDLELDILGQQMKASDSQLNARKPKIKRVKKVMTSNQKGELIRKIKGRMSFSACGCQYLYLQ